jgi:hypothetical protein
MGYLLITLNKCVWDALVTAKPVSMHPIYVSVANLAMFCITINVYLIVLLGCLFSQLQLVSHAKSIVLYAHHLQLVLNVAVLLIFIIMPVLIVVQQPMQLSSMVHVQCVLVNSVLLVIMQMYALLVKVVIFSSMLYVLSIAHQDTTRTELIALQQLHLLLLNQQQDSLSLFQ